MTIKIQKFGIGLKTETQQEYVSGEWIDVDTINVDLSSLQYTPAKLSTSAIETYPGLPGQILMINDSGVAEWTDSAILNDKILREEYPSLQIAWNNVMEVLNEYEMVKKLVQDYDKK